MEPTVAGYLAFLRDSVGIPTAALPDDSPWIGATFDFALKTVNMDLQVVDGGSPAYPSYYAIAVYNFGMAMLVEWAPDQSGQTYFAALRDRFKIFSFIAGAISSSSDNGTSQSIDVADAFKGLTIADLQMLKTPWGRAYLGMAQNAGPTIWGLS